MIRKSNLIVIFGDVKWLDFWVSKIFDTLNSLSDFRFENPQPLSSA